MRKRRSDRRLAVRIDWGHGILKSEHAGAGGPVGFLMESNVTKQQITAAVLECADKLGRVPSHTELIRNSSVSRKQVRWHFGGYTQLLRECKLEAAGSGYRVNMDELFRDWAGIARALKKLPTIAEYERGSRYSVRPLVTRFGSWSQAPLGLKQYAETQGWTEEWKDVLEMVEARGLDGTSGAAWSALLEGLDDAEGAGKSTTGAGLDGIAENAGLLDKALRRRVGRPAYGPLMRPYPLICGPVNEMGVVYLFGAMAEKLGFVVLRIQQEFPDCEALMLVDGDRCELVRIEFEYESRNFLKHMHEPGDCDLIVCWKHNWPECPLDVVELKTALSSHISAFSQERLAADLRR